MCMRVYPLKHPFLFVFWKRSASKQPLKQLALPQHACGHIASKTFGSSALGVQEIKNKRKHECFALLRILVLREIDKQFVRSVLRKMVSTAAFVSRILQLSLSAR